ncbi:hypothetical protein SAMN03080617_00476 [Algoriphagus alkaliphilus]|uniref:Outer membrane insertion C-terminal signal n=1 Tax=Algoriphagus alkaliphilus TaxID=279824 RepID=A0A1G5VEA6_9BACT|nr:hypothetical protein [Algoriphagus alkaliphilus]SDA44169.1 hypothetical protein SAMN03080617_00476 [Algoriphagus alkaliphilus]
MKFRKILVLLFAVCFFQSSFAQETASNENGKWQVGLEGMLGVSFGKNFYSVNVGGPALFLTLTKDLKIGVGALPSLYSLDGKLGARLGVSPRIDYKNLVLIAPFFHRDTADEWIGSIGIGYKFHRKTN